MRVGWLDPRVLGEPEPFLETCDEIGRVLQRAAEEDDRAFQGASACKPSDRLPHHGVVGARRNVGFARSRVEQRAGVGLGEYGASRGDGVDRAGLEGQIAHVRGIDAEHERDGVDESPPVPPAQVVFILCSTSPPR